MLQSRRHALKQTAAGFGMLALCDLLARTQTSVARAVEPYPAALSDAQTSPMFPAKAKRVIFLFMHGGVSQVDTFDYKPQLLKHSGQPLPFEKPRVQFAETGNLLRSPWRFRQYGDSGRWVSDLFPNVAKHVDDLAFIHSIHGSNEAHGGALLKIHTGSDTFVRPSMGAWISYGLGTENSNLPGFVTMAPTLGHGGVQNFGSAFLPANHQAMRIGESGTSSKDAKISFLRNDRLTPEQQRAQLDLIRQLDAQQRQQYGPDADLEARIQSFELAFRMQTTAPQVMDLGEESPDTLKLYGIGDRKTDHYGRQCLWARRFAESGVRFIQCSHRYWDQHSQLREKHSELAAEVDQPISALLTDLKQRGLLDDTLVVWGTEFGRTPTAQGNDGRDHNPHGFTWWMAGGGVTPGTSYGATDDYGYYAAVDKVHIHDLHATILHLLGIDHTKLTYRYAGRDFRLTDVHGRVVHDVIG